MRAFNYNTDAEERFWSKVAIPDNIEACWMWNGTKSRDGYGQFKYHVAHKRPHRFLWESLHGEIPKGMVIMHLCDTPGCVNPEHLQLGTHSDNAIDRNRKGRDNHARGSVLSSAGEKHPNCKLTGKQIEYIRKRYAEGNISQAALAREMGVAQAHISRIILRQRWT